MRCFSVRCKHAWSSGCGRPVSARELSGQREKLFTNVHFIDAEDDLAKGRHAATDSVELGWACWRRTTVYLADYSAHGSSTVLVGAPGGTEGSMINECVEASAGFVCQLGALNQVLLLLEAQGRSLWRVFGVGNSSPKVNSIRIVCNVGLASCSLFLFFPEGVCFSRMQLLLFLWKWMLSIFRMVFVRFADATFASEKKNLKMHVAYILNGFLTILLMQHVLYNKNVKKKTTATPRSGKQGHTRIWTNPSSKTNLLELRSSRSKPQPLPCASQLKSCQVRSTPGNVRTGQAKWSEVKSCEVTWGQAKWDQVRTSQDKSRNVVSILWSTSYSLVLLSTRVWSTLLCSTMFYSCSTLFYSLIFYSILLVSSILFDSILLCTLVSTSLLIVCDLSLSILLYDILLCSVVLCSNLFCPVPICSTPSVSIWYSIVFFSILFCYFIVFSFPFLSFPFFSFLFFSFLFFSFPFFSFFLFCSILVNSSFCFSILIYSDVCFSVPLFSTLFRTCTKSILV